VAKQFRRFALTVAILLLATGTLLAYLGVSTPVAFTILAAGGLALWGVDRRTTVLGYAASLAVQVFHSLAVFRVAVSDLFMLPAAAKSLLDAHRTGEGLPRSSLTRPFGLLLALFGVANVVAIAENGGLSSYAIVNKDLGIVYLIVGYYTMLYFLRDRSSMERLARAFVLGVSWANAAALGTVLLAWGGFQNDVYLVGNLRLYGWMLNPSLFGGVVLVAAMLELAALTGKVEPNLNPWRWLNIGLLGVSIALTISRGIWLATAVAAGALFVLQIAGLQRRPRLPELAVTLAWAGFPAAALAGIVSANPASLTIPLAEERAATLKFHLVEQCRVNPALDLCPSVEMPPVVIDAPPAAIEMPRAAIEPRESTGIESAATTPSGTFDGAYVRAPFLVPPFVSLDSPASTVPETAMTNTRGLQDRVAILQVGLREYVKTLRRTILGIGLGTFYATSAGEFGVPLIIHNTFAWFLIEMGPLGLIVVVWIWVVTARNLLTACRAHDWRLPLAIGASAAFAGLTIFCVINEGFYQRHLWLVIALADRMAAGIEAPTPQAPIGVPVHI
jgi:hypothetical protein